MLRFGDFKSVKFNGLLEWLVIYFPLLFLFLYTE